MAELTKKLQVKVSGTTTPCKIYSTSAEAGTSYVRAKVDNVEAYIPLVDASDDRASKVHIGSKNIATTGKPPYTEKSWTTAGTYTFTVPAGVTRIRVAVCGGGGGAAYSYRSEEIASNGGDSIFGSITATGGGGGHTRTGTGETGIYEGGSGGTPNGNAGGGTWTGTSVSGGNGFALSFTQTAGSYGQGGTVAGERSGLANALAGGGSGGYISTYLNVSSNQLIEVKVGAASSNLGANRIGYVAGRNAVSGFVLIAFGGDI